MNGSPFWGLLIKRLSDAPFKTWLYFAKIVEPDPKTKESKKFIKTFYPTTFLEQDRFVSLDSFA